jgi:hypothetical protein
MQHGHFLYLEFGDEEIRGHFSLLIVWGNGAEEVGIFARLCQCRGCCGRRNGDDFGILVNSHCSLGCTGANMANHGNDFVACQFGSHVGSNFWLALIVLNDELDLLAIDATFRVYLFDDQLCSIDRWQAIRSQITRMCSCNANFDGGRCKDRLCTKECYEAHHR